MQDQGQGGGGGDMISMIDDGISQIGQALSQQPGAEKLAQRLAAVQKEYRSIMEEAMSMMGGSQGGGSQAVPDRSQGMPQSPAGAY